MSISLPTLAGQNPICHTCKHWTRRHDWMGEDPAGECEKINANSDAPLVEIRGASAFGAVDHAVLVTPAHFGCTLWEGRRA